MCDVDIKFLPMFDRTFSNFLLPLRAQPSICNDNACSTDLWNPGSSSTSTGQQYPSLPSDPGQNWSHSEELSEWCPETGEGKSFLWQHLWECQVHVIIHGPWLIGIFEPHFLLDCNSLRLTLWKFYLHLWLRWCWADYKLHPSACQSWMAMEAMPHVDLIMKVRRNWVRQDVYNDGKNIPCVMLVTIISDAEQW